MFEQIDLLVFQQLEDPQSVNLVKRALAQGVVLDTWMNGENEEQFDMEAETAMVTASQKWTCEALRSNAIFPVYPMPEQYVRCVFTELLSSMALYSAQYKKGCREVTIKEVEDAIDCLEGFIAREPDGLTALGRFFFIVSTHEDLNAIEYYGRMKKDDFLFGRLHRPWSNMALYPQLLVYQRMDLVNCLYAGQADMLSLTRRGLNLLATLRKILNAAGEFAWRSDNQRWVIADETDYDQALDLVFPDSNRNTAEYLNRLGLQRGMNILEIGAGTGKTTVDAGLCRLVGSHGSVVAFDRSVVFLRQLAEKCRQRDIKNVQLLQGMAENLPFPDNSFDASIAVHTLHFTDAPQVVAEMARVTKPGGFISALSPPPEFDMREIPMLASLFRPLAKTVAQTGLPFGEHNGLARGLLKELFERNTVDTEVWNAQFTWSAEDHISYLTFMLKTDAYLQNFLCRLPFHERWSIIRRLENEGINIARETSRQDKLGVGFLEAALGRIPANKPYKGMDSL